MADETLTHKSERARAIAGVAALTEMVDCIGREGSNDHDVAAILTRYELELRALLGLFQGQQP